MNTNDELTHEVQQLLRPIKKHPSLEPRQQFVVELQHKIREAQTSNKKRFNLMPLAAVFVATLLFTVVVLSNKDVFNLELAGEADKPFAIAEESKLTLLRTIEYGEGEGKAGLTFLGEGETFPVTVTSFDVKDGTFYILDEAKRQVLIVGKDGKIRSFPIKGNSEMGGTLMDILVTPDKQIYILDSWVSRVVYQYTEKGKLVKTHKLKEELFHPDELVFVKNIGVLASEVQERFLNIETGKMEEVKSLPYHMKRANPKEAVITMNNEEKQTNLTIPYEEGVGQSAIEAITEEEVIFTKTELPAVYASLTETHVLAYNKQGETLGGIRVPIEKLMEETQMIKSKIKVDKNKIYYLSPEKEHIAIYELTLGKRYDSFIQKQVEEVKIGFDYKTFGRPFPELEKELKKLFTSGTIFSQYGDENSVNGAAIDDSGTVVIDLKEFHAGSPSSHQAGQIGKALNEAIFEKFPEVQKVYLQFDGSFSAWCIWMETTEEPWERH
ncbi:hypothetical protein D1B31_15320 [Neobacillus notoginsengisoli]|uniref:6-bladed beta-propeller n=1 Tax=Neobacillus notoginsengisoli TaxID=1578198 RepID=A0A417YS63_9BACI|nr:hypothetical protein [Neobacillus notoginsengisoli]RHW38144.1 hypothetical protein D1B31_15320 [Neobacillus notoginsengisoli]